MNKILVNKEIAFFDFDGTITNKDSLNVFTKDAVGYFNFYIGLMKISPFLLMFKLKIIKNYQAKNIYLNHFFKRWDYANFKYISNKYSINELDKIIRIDALKRINWHKEEGHEVAIVTASIDSWLNGWCKKNNINLISTKINLENNKIKDSFFIKNCYGEEKVNRILQEYNLKDYKTIYAYGDSTGDREMLSIANKKFYKFFN